MISNVNESMSSNANKKYFGYRWHRHAVPFDVLEEYRREKLLERERTARPDRPGVDVFASWRDVTSSLFPGGLQRSDSDAIRSPDRRIKRTPLPYLPARSLCCFIFYAERRCHVVRLFSNTHDFLFLFYLYNFHLEHNLNLRTKN